MEKESKDYYFSVQQRQFQISMRERERRRRRRKYHDHSLLREYGRKD